MPDNINGIPIRWDYDELNRQIAPLFPNGYDPDAFLKTQTGAKFPKSDSPFGENSVFNDPCGCECEYEYKPAPDTSKYGVNISLLAEDLDINNQTRSLDQKNGGPLERNKFVYTRYLTDKTSLVVPNRKYRQIEYAGLQPYPEKANIEIEYPGSDGNTNFTNTRALLNKVECCVDTFPRVGIRIKPGNCIFTVCYTYKVPAYQYNNVSNLMNDLTVSGYLNPGQEYFKYIAINLRFSNAEQLIVFLEKTKSNLVDFYRNRIIDEFIEALAKAEDDGEDLNQLYQVMPEFAAKAIGKLPGGEERLFKHLAKLLKYDDTGLWSNSRDSSNAVINLMKGFSDYKTLYEKFWSDPALLKRIYSDLQGINFQNNTETPNRSIFCSFLAVLCNACFDPQKITGRAFYIGEGYELDSNIDSDYDISEGKIFLRQSKTPQPLDLKVLDDPKGGDLRSYFPELQQKPVIKPVSKEKVSIPVRKEEPTPEFGWFHPLEMVRLVYADEGKTILVPAILVKDISDLIEKTKIDAEWKELLKNLRIGVDVFVAAFSLVIALSNPGTAILRGLLLTGGLAVADATIVTYEDEIRKMPWGPEFLAAWENFQGMLGSYGLSELAGVVLSKGVKILAAIKNVDLRTYITGLMMRALFEIKGANFYMTTIEILNAEKAAEVLNAPAFRKAKFTRLEDKGVLFLKETSPTILYGTKAITEGEIAVVYKGRVIARGSAKNVRETLKDVFESSYEKKLTGALDTLWNMVPQLKGKQWMAFNKAGIELRWDNQLGNIQSIISARLKTTTKPGKLWEAEFAQELSKYDEVFAVGNDVEIFKNGKKIKRAGDYDVLSQRYLIECKSSITKSTLADKDFISSFDKYLKQDEAGYINLERKQVVLGIKELKGVNRTHRVLQKLEDSGVKIIISINQIKTLK